MKRVVAVLVVLLWLAFPFCSHAQEKAQGQQGPKVWDLSHELSEEIPVFPGGIPFQKRAAATMERDGYLAHRLQLGEHTGTHVDAPIHFEPGALSVGELPVERLIGPGVRISIATKTAGESILLRSPDGKRRKKLLQYPDVALDTQDIAQWEAVHGPIPKGAVVLVDSGWASRWSNPARYRNSDKDGKMHFPGSSSAAAVFLTERGVKAVGVDTLSVDPGVSEDFLAHRIFAERGIVAIENLTNLDQLPEEGFDVVIAPLKIRGGSGAPARVFAFQGAGLSYQGAGPTVAKARLGSPRAAPAPRGPAGESGQGEGDVSLKRWLPSNPIQENEEISIKEIHRTPEWSAHVVQIRTREKSHLHKDHDVIVILERGRGTLSMGTQRRVLTPGTIAFIPRGVVHQFVNESEEPALAFVISVPPSDSKDTVPAEFTSP